MIRHKLQLISNKKKQNQQAKRKKILDHKLSQLEEKQHTDEINCLSYIDKRRDECWY